VACHPLHGPVQALLQPVAQVGLVLAQFHAGNAAALEAELARQFAHAAGEGHRVGVGGRGGGQGHARIIGSGRYTPAERRPGRR